MQHCWLYELAVGFRAAEWTAQAKKLPKDSLPADTSSSYLLASTEIKKMGVVDLSAQVSGTTSSSECADPTCFAAISAHSAQPSKGLYWQSSQNSADAEQVGWRLPGGEPAAVAHSCAMYARVVHTPVLAYAASSTACARSQSWTRPTLHTQPRPPSPNGWLDPVFTTLLASDCRCRHPMRSARVEQARRV